MTTRMKTVLTEKFFGCIGVLVMIAASIAFVGFLIMMLFGVLHGSGLGVAAVGYWPSCVIGLLLMMLSSALLQRR